jgi:DNA-binding response OmpR family regulator
MKKLLIADDDKAMLGLLTTLLELEGYIVVTETDPDKIFDVVHEERPDLVLLDVHVEGQETMDVLQKIKSDSTLGNIPVMMISGMELQNQVMILGADKFILKPFHPQELLDSITPLLDNGEGTQP